MNKLTFLSLAGSRVRDVQLSDHEPIIDQNMISWNVMMPGKRRKDEFNNGFALIETETQYHNRLRLIASVLAELCGYNPNISVICLQEGPVREEDLAVFIESCLQFSSLHPFVESLLDPNTRTAWGLFTLVNTQFFDYQSIAVPQAKDNLKERIQALLLTDLKNETSRLNTNLHLPYEFKHYPGRMAQWMYQLLNHQPSAFTVTGDFNFSLTEPEIHHMLRQCGHIFAPKHNSTEYHAAQGGSNTLETVDAIISNSGITQRPIINLAQTSLLRFTRGYCSALLRPHNASDDKQKTIDKPSRSI
jgi:hypothetical protein